MARRFFVAEIYARQFLPRRLLKPFWEAAIHTRNPSANRAFIEPCIATHGTACVLAYLLHTLQTGSDEEKAGAVSAAYWAQGNPLHEDLTALHQTLRHTKLQLFVSHPHLQLRRNLIAALRLDATAYPADLQPLVQQAINIARQHADDYIRHRVEIQLGSPAPLKPLPHD